MYSFQLHTLYSEGKREFVSRSSEGLNNIMYSAVTQLVDC